MSLDEAVRQARSKRSRPADPKQEIVWQVIRDRAVLDALVPEWAGLYRSSQTPNPFSHPAWVTTWLDHFTQPDDLYAVAGRAGGDLVALAPFHRRRPRLHSPFPGTVLRLAGIGAGELLTEVPEILVAGHPTRKVLRGLIRFLLDDCSQDWDWTEFTLSPRLGWFESDWIGPEWEARGVRFAHRATQAFVVLDLPEEWSQLRSGMKRNIKEAVRRSTNRLAKVEGGWEYTVPASEADVASAIDLLVRLHGARSQVTDKELHSNYLQSPGDEAFLKAAALALFRAGAAAVPLIRVAGEDAAVRLILRGNDSVFLSLSGMAPEHWDLGLGTQLTVQALQGAIAEGIGSANLSVNPDESKLRWSERLELHNEFMITSPRRGARAAAGAYLLRDAARNARQLAH
jgi:CelD/BcsL family acetyltransferase involved in cellulose biosynthesis